MKIKKKVIPLIVAIVMTIPFLGNALMDIPNYFNKISAQSSLITNEQIRILEIQPTNKFHIEENKNKLTGIIEQTIDKKTVIVEHITMTEFIGKVDKINGKYDVIIIGGQYSDYDVMDVDITNRKADEIVKFLESNQLVYISDKIVLPSNISVNQQNLKNIPKVLKRLGERKAVEWTYPQQYIGIKNRNNLIRIDTASSNFNTKYIVNQYKQKNLNKRTTVEVTQYPEGDVGDGYGNLESRNLSYKFNLKSNGNFTAPVNVKLYLDMNDDGLFKEEEKVQEINSVQVPSSNIEMKYNLRKNFIGYLKWKLEITDSNNVKSYVTSYFKINRLKGVNKVVRVLQIMDESNSAQSSAGQNGKLNLEKNTRFNELVKEVENKGYIIKIKSIGADEFYKGNYKGPGTKEYKEINGNYDMVIIGFNDAYPSDKITQQGLDELEKFAQTGQSIMFTHDTMWYIDGIISDDTRETYRIIRKFADYIGQSRFENNHNIPSTAVDFTGKNIPHDPDKPTFTQYEQFGDRKQMGSTKGVRYTSFLDYMSTKVYRTNDSTITNYPYKLNSEINVRRTHIQYLQLNFEDEDVVPWFNLTDVDDGYGVGESSNSDKYDSRNYYYTYSKGNITFSGTGETSRDSGDYPLEELQLFMNTIIKASRGANCAPIIETTIDERPEEKYDVEINQNEDYTFKARAIDYDEDKVKLKVSLKGGNVANWTLIAETDGYINQEEYMTDPVIDKKYLKENTGKILEVKLEAEDEHGAKSEKIYRLLPVNSPELKITTQEGKGLVGDEISASINLEKLNLENSRDIKINSISLGNYDKSIFDDVVLPTDVSFDNKNKATVELKTKTLCETNEFIPINLKYQVYKKYNQSTTNSNLYKEKTVEVKVPISSKKGIVNLKIVNDEKEDVKANVTLSRNDKEVSTVNLTSMSYTWPNDTKNYILSGTYKVSINNLQEIEAEIVSETNQNATLNYNKPIADIQINISTGRDGEVLSHGFLDSKEDRYTIEEYDEKNTNPNVIKGMYYSIGTEVEVGRNNSQWEITVPNGGEIADKKVKLYEVKISGKDTIIKSVSNKESVSVEGNTIKASKLCKNKKYLLSYIAKFDDDCKLKSELINKNKNSVKLFKVILQRENNDNPYLPEAF